MNRRSFLQVAGAAALGLSQKSLMAQEKLPPIRAITKGPKFHWFGYYDKFQFDPTNRFVLANQVDFEHRSPRADDVIRVGMVDLQDGDKWIELGTTRAWNWQQGCMLQWVPGTNSTVMWNDREDGQFVCHLLDVQSGKKRTIGHPVYNLSPDGKWGIAPDFRRLNDCRPGYGYAGIADPNKDKLIPKDAGLWRINMESGQQELLISFADAAQIPYEGGFSNGAKHWFNHLLFSPDGERFIFLHRWRGDKEGGGFSTRLFTASKDGKELFDLDPLGKTSHFVWRDPAHVFAWAFYPSHGERFYLYKDKTREVSVVGPDKMTVNGHNTYVPGTDYNWVLNDTYPDKERLQHPYLYHVPTDRRLPLGHFYSPKEYKGEWRCDTHPRSSRDGKLACIDSPHGGNGRQMYIIEIGDLIGK
jgi:hypothetical protein